MRKRNLSAATPWYPVELPISFEDAGRSLFQGDGKTRAISSGAVRFASGRDLPVGVLIRLVIQWPAKLRDGTSLSLSVMGRVQRSELGEVEATFSQHEFRAGYGEGIKPVILIDARARA